jgi:hypothetical protein
MACTLGSDDLEIIRCDSSEVTSPQPQTRMSEDIATVYCEGKRWLFGFCSLVTRVPDVVQDRCTSARFVSASQGSDALITTFGYCSGDWWIKVDDLRREIMEL